MRQSTLTTGQRVRAAREAAELTQDELAERVGDGLTQSYVARLEAGKHDPTVPMLRRLAVALGCPLADLIGD